MQAVLDGLVAAAVLAPGNVWRFRGLCVWQLRLGGPQGYPGAADAWLADFASARLTALDLGGCRQVRPCCPGQDVAPAPLQPRPPAENGPADPPALPSPCPGSGLYLDRGTCPSAHLRSPPLKPRAGPGRLLSDALLPTCGAPSRMTVRLEGFDVMKR